MSNKQLFLIEHNKLAPMHLQATLAVLTRFRVEKPTIFKNDDWSIDKLRRPFIMWLTGFNAEEIKNMG